MRREGHFGPARPWTPDEDERLALALEACMTAAQAAKYVGQRSRNSVIGRAQRLGLQLKNPISRNLVSKKPKATVKNPRGAKAGTVPHSSIPPRKDHAAIAGRTAAVMACENGKCRFPVGDPMGEPETFGFCMEPVERGSYCAAHAAACYSGTNEEARIERRVSWAKANTHLPEAREILAKFDIR